MRIFWTHPWHPLLVAGIAIALHAARPAHAAEVRRTEIAGAAQPQLAIGANGKVWLVYGRFKDTPDAPAEHGAHAHGEKPKGHPPQAPRGGEVFVTSSNDGGATFAPAVKVAGLQKIMLGMRRGPRIAVRGERITVTVMADELLAFMSADGGKTWSGPSTVNDVATSAREGLHDLASAPDGGLFITWLDLRNGAMELWSATSRDGGKTWGKNERVYKSPDKSICECCHPSALFDADGNLAVMWRNSMEGSRDMWMVTRAKGATHFTAPRKLGEGTWKLNACPMDGGRILALGGGRFGAIWQRNGEVFMSRADGAETSLGKGKQPVAAPAGAAGPTFFWQDGSDLVRLDSETGAKAATQVVDARFPSVVALPGEKALVLAYERGPKGATSIVVERL